MTGTTGIPFRETNFLPVDLDVERRADGTIVLQSRRPLAAHEPCLPRVLATQASRLGDKPYLVQRRGPERAWTPHSYAQTKRDADAIAQWLLDRGISRDRPILLLSGNSIAHALVKLGGMTAGVPACPVSANYGMMDTHFARLRHVVDLVRPGVVFVENAKPFARALQQVDFRDAIVLTGTPADVPAPDSGAPRQVAALDDVLATRVTPAVAERLATLRGDDHAAYMLTSGSTGLPKAVVQTYANIMANVAQAQQTIGEGAGWARCSRSRPAARCTSTKASRCRGRSGRSRCATCATCRAATTSTYRSATSCWSRRSRPTKNCGERSSET
jgi:feruloyl-CoA synthase